MSDLELMESTVELLFAGYQTNASTVTSAIINLIKNPRVFKKIECELRMHGFLPQSHSSSTNQRSDIDEISVNGEIAETSSIIDNSMPTTNILRKTRVDENHQSEFQCNNNNVAKNDNEANKHRSLHEDEDESEVTMERLSKLEYIDHVIKETLRVMPPILGGYRIALKTFRLGVSSVQCILVSLVSFAQNFQLLMILLDKYMTLYRMEPWVTLSFHRLVIQYLTIVLNGASTE